MGQLKFEPRTLDSDIVRDGLCAISKLEDSPVSRGLSFVVGGIATQSYLPTSCRRGTSDIDLAVLSSHSYGDFKNFCKIADEYLNDAGYYTQTNKGHNSHQLIYFKGLDAGVIEFARRSASNYERIRERLNREKKNTRRKIVEERDATYEVSSPEDIVVPKIVRSVGSLLRNPDFCSYVRGSKPLPLTDKCVSRELRYIKDLRNEATVHMGDVRLTERLRFVSDIFDIRVLSELVGFNEGYLEEAIASWDRLKGDNPVKVMLFNYLLPRMSTHAD